MKLFPEEVKLKRPRGIPAFPLRTEEEWENLEKILVNDDAFLYVVNISEVYSIFRLSKITKIFFVCLITVSDKIKIINNVNLYVKLLCR